MCFRPLKIPLKIDSCNFLEAFLSIKIPLKNDNCLFSDETNTWVNQIGCYDSSFHRHHYKSAVLSANRQSYVTDISGSRGQCFKAVKSAVLVAETTPALTGSTCSRASDAVNKFYCDAGTYFVGASTQDNGFTLLKGNKHYTCTGSRSASWIAVSDTGPYGALYYCTPRI